MAWAGSMQYACSMWHGHAQHGHFLWHKQQRHLFFMGSEEAASIAFHGLAALMVLPRQTYNVNSLRRAHDLSSRAAA